jgi:hypothetical protein
LPKQIPLLGLKAEIAIEIDMIALRRLHHCGKEDLHSGMMAHHRPDHTIKAVGRITIIMIIPNLFIVGV